MVSDNYLKEYAEKAYLQYPGYSLEKARINFPIYYPSIANYYLQFKARELERLQIDAATNLASRVAAEASGALYITNQILTKDISPILDDVIGEMRNLNTLLDYSSDSSNKEFTEAQLDKYQNLMQQNYQYLTKLSSITIAYRIHCTLIGGKKFSLYKDTRDRLNQINIKYQQALTSISTVKGRLYG